MELKDYIIKPDISVIDAIKAIEMDAKGIVYVCDPDNHLLGTITDGDVRRYIIHGGNLNAQCVSVMNPSPIFLPYNMRHKAYECMENYVITSVPILDADNRIVEIFFAYESVRTKHALISSPVAIMAGGKGTRLAPYTHILPKPLIPIGEKTITEHIIDHFKEFGCQRFDMIVNYKRHLIKSYFKDVPIDVELNFFDEDEFLGTAGGLRLLRGRYAEPFFMSNCDILVDADYSKIMKHHTDSDNFITIVSAVKNANLPYGVLEATTDGLVSDIREKPYISTVVNTGLYILDPGFLDIIPADTFVHITDVIKKCIKSGHRVGMYPVPGERWLDMGQIDELKLMEESLRST